VWIEMRPCPAPGVTARSSLSFGTVWIEITRAQKFVDNEVSLSFGTVWIEIPLAENPYLQQMSLSFGTVWIEINAGWAPGTTALVTVLRDGVD